MKTVLEILEETPSLVSLDEKFIYKVNSKGKKRKKLKCPNGMKPNPAGTSCVPIRATEKRNHKIGARQARRTVKAKGSAFKARKVRKTRKAMRFRRNLGL